MAISSPARPEVAGHPGGNDGNPRILGLACRECGGTYPISPIHVCERCFGPLEVQYDYELIYYPYTTDDGSPEGQKLPQPDAVTMTASTSALVHWSTERRARASASCSSPM